MAAKRKIVKHISTGVKKGVNVASPHVKRAARTAAHHGSRVARTGVSHSKRAAKAVHRQVIARPHVYMKDNWAWYAKWHNWKWHRVVHYSTLGTYLFLVGLVLFSTFRIALAADLTNDWDFSTPGDYSLDSGAEIDGNSARLKAQEYASDASTAALYHFNEASGTSVADSSSYANNGTASSAPTWGTGNLKGAATLNGTSQYVSAADSSSLSLGSQQSIEGWIKPSSTFNTSSDSSQTIVDKGSHKVSLDRTSGKMTYEIQSNSSNSWTRQMGNDLNGSWSINHTEADSSASDGTNYYAGIGGTTGDAEVWKWNGTTWTKIGGDGINSSWADQSYENVYSLTYASNTLYAGLGAGTGDGEVWSCSTTSNCATWTKIGGDGTGLTINTYETVQSMVVSNGSLYVGTGTQAGDGDVWKYNGGTSWTQVGGDGLNSGWAASTIEAVYSMTTDGTNLYVGTGLTTTDADVWRYNGTSWTQIGGDGLNSGFNTNYEIIRAMTYFGGNLYVGLGESAAGDAEVWKYNGSVWSQIGGDSISSSWPVTSATAVFSLTNDGSNLYVGIGGTSDVWKWSGSAWTKIAGAGVNNSWTTSTATGLQYIGTKLYAMPWSTTTYGSAAWSFDGTTWTNIGGGYLNNSWGGFNTAKVMSSTNYNGKMYVGVGNGTNTAYVYEWDGTTARIVGGGAAVNGSWPGWTYETVDSMIAYKGNLYVGLGWNGGDGEVWKWNGSTWTKVAGDGLNSSLSGPNAVGAMAVYGGKLYISSGNSNSVYGQIWQYDETTWTKIGGNGTNGLANVPTYSALTVYSNQLCAGNGLQVGAAQVWCWTGSGNWTKIGGDGVNSSWATVATATKSIGSLIVYNGSLYAGMADTATLSGEVWKWNGTAWTQVGGNSLNSGWADSTYGMMSAAVVYNGELYFGTGNEGGATNGAGDIWKWNGTAWTQVGGDNLLSGWGSTIESVPTLAVYKGKLYAGTGVTINSDANMYSFGNNGYVETTTSSFDTSWRHFAATFDGVTAKIYLNGTLDGSASASGSSVDNSLPLLIGKGYGSRFSGEGEDFFAGSLDEIRISTTARTSFTTKPYSDTEQGVVLASSVRRSGVSDWESFSSNETLNGGTVTYRLSDDDGATWQYWNGSAWVVSSGLTQANAASVTTANIAAFPVTFDGIKWQAVLKGDGTQQVTLNSVQLQANSDTTDPDTNASDILAFKSNGGSVLGSNGWTNGGSPYFSWTAGTDAGSGILGYCLYLGQTPSEDPVTSKGQLGTSPLDVGTSCQFAVPSTNIDLATSGILATALTTSNTPYYLNVRAIDEAGNVFGSSEQFQFRFDNTAPANPGYVAAPSGFINTKTASITWPTSGGDAASDANSGILGLQYRIGGTSWYGDSHTGAGDINDLLANDGSYTTVDPPDFDNMVDGINTVYFRTWDQAGNYSTSYVTAVLKVNTSGAPSEPQNVTALPTTNVVNAFEFSWDAPQTFNTTTGQADKLRYCYVINTLPNANNCNFTDLGETTLESGAYATQPGANTLYVVAKDDFDEINYSSYATATFTANTPAPGIPTNIDVADVSVKTSNNWRLAVTWDQPTNVGAGVSAYKVYRSTDNSNFAQVGSSSSTSFVDSGLSQIVYYYKIMACDSANNCGAFTTTVSLLPTGKYTESANMTSEPTTSGVTTKKATITWSTDRVSDSKIAIGTASGEYSPSEVGNSSQVTAHKIDMDNLAAGTTYYYQARWTDVDGNTGVSQEYTFTTAPAPVLKEVTTLAVNLSSATLQFTIKDAAKVQLQYGKSDSFGGEKSINTSLSESTYAMEIEGLDDGTKYLYRLVMSDSEGGRYQSSIFSFTTPPRPNISNLRFQPLSGEPTSTQQVTWTTNIPANSMVTYGKVGTDGTVIQATELKTTHEIIIRGLEDDSEYFLVAQGRDGNGNVATSERQTFKTALDTRAPAISDIVIEPTIRGTGAEARGQIVVSWKTDEPSTSQVAYADGSAATVFNNRTAEDAQLTTEHIVIISDLPPSKVYSIMPVSKDKSGNASNTPAQAAIIGRASDSVLNIVLNTLRKVFGL